MTDLKVITCIQKHTRYLNAFNKSLKRNIYAIFDDDIQAIKQAALYGVKYVSTHKYADKHNTTREEVEEFFQIVQLVRWILMKLPPKEFVNLFPITKEYDGDKYNCKDYFYTVNQLQQYNMDEPLSDQLDDFLWDYANDTICRFVVQGLTTVSELRQFQGYPSLLEQWAAENNIGTYTLNERDGYILDNRTHRTVPYKKVIPDYIRVAK